MELLIEILGIILFCIVLGIIIWFIDDFHNNINKILQMIKLVAVPNNTGVRRLCLVVAIVLCCIMAIMADWDDFLGGDIFIILYLLYFLHFSTHQLCLICNQKKLLII